jgi:TnpA family transposase
VQARAVKTVSEYPCQNSLALARREVGRLERSAFILDWLLRNPELLRRASAFFFHRLGELLHRTFENQIYCASGLNLHVAAIILWNTRYL